MIPKGNQRGGGQQLAAHLTNSFDNESVEIADLRGAVARDLSGAFAEWYAQAKGTKSKKYLYSLSLNPDQRQGQLTREQYMDFIARTERKLNLENQPRAIVFHVKEGRQHAHVVWSRIDTSRMRAVPMSHDRQKLRRVVQEFARDNGLTLPESMRKDKGRERFEAQKKIVDLGEKQQEERTGIRKAERMAAITEAWSRTGDGDAFVRALAEKDYFIARGDRRGYVVIDLGGEVHSLARQIIGANTADLKARLSALPPDRLPPIPEAQAHAQKLREQRQRAVEQPRPEPGVPMPEQRRILLAEQQQERRREIEAEREALRLRHAQEAGKLSVEHALINAGIVRKREERIAKGYLGVLTRIPGLGRAALSVLGLRDQLRQRQQRAEMLALRLRQRVERAETHRKLAALTRVQRRETRSLETAIRREAFQRVAGIGKDLARDGKGKSRPPEKAAPVLVPDGALRQAFAQALQPVAAKPPLPSKKTGLRDFFNKASEALEQTRSTPQPDSNKGREALRAAFTAAASDKSEATPDEPGRDALRDAFTAAANGDVESTLPAPGAEPSFDSLREEFNRLAAQREPAAPEPTPDEPAAETTFGGLKDQFNRLADQKDKGRENPGREYEKNYRRPSADYSIRR